MFGQGTGGPGLFCGQSSVGLSGPRLGPGLQERQGPEAKLQTMALRVSSHKPEGQWEKPTICLQMSEGLAEERWIGCSVWFRRQNRAWG